MNKQEHMYNAMHREHRACARLSAAQDTFAVASCIMNLLCTSILQCHVCSQWDVHTQKHGNGTVANCTWDIDSNAVHFSVYVVTVCVSNVLAEIACWVYTGAAKYQRHIVKFGHSSRDGSNANFVFSAYTAAAAVFSPSSF